MLSKKGTREVLFLQFEKACNYSNRNDYTLLFEALEPATSNAFLTWETNGLLDDIMYKLARFYDFTLVPIGHPIKSFTFTVTVASFLKKWAESSIANEEKFK